MEQLSIRDWMILIGGMMIVAVLIDPIYGFIGCIRVSCTIVVVAIAAIFSESKSEVDDES